MSYLLGGPPTSSSSSSANPGGYTYTPSAPSSGGYTPSAAASGGYSPTSSYNTGGYTPSAAAMSYTPPAPAPPAMGYHPSYTPQYQQPQYQQQQQQYQQPHAWASQVPSIVNQQQHQQQHHQQHPSNTTGTAVMTGMSSATALQIEVCVVQYGKKVKLDLEVEPSDTLNDLKEMAADEIGIPAGQQIVKFNNKEITNNSHWTLQQLGIPSLSTLHISKRENAPLLTVILHKENNRTYGYKPQTMELELDFKDTTLQDIREMVAMELNHTIHVDQVVLKYNKKILDSKTLTLEKLNFKEGAQLVVYQKEAPLARNANNNNNQADANSMIQGEDLNTLKMEFNKIDTDGSGYIDHKELSKALGRWMPSSLVKMAMTYADSNRDGKIDFREYCKIRKQIGGMKLPSGGKKKPTSGR